MSKATLNYIIDGKELSISRDSLVALDRYTCKYKDDDELRLNSPLRNRIHSFIKENGSKGQFLITYVDGYRKKSIRPLYGDDKPIILYDDYMNGKSSEVERARKLLFNSKDQIYSREVYNNRNIRDSLSMEIKINDEDASILKYYEIPVKDEYMSHYVRFIDILRFRIKNRKLGLVRPIYEDMLDLYKKEIEKLSIDDLYFYSREFRILYNDYLLLRRNFTVSRLRARENVQILGSRFTLAKSSYISRGKIKVYKKN